MRTFAVCVFLLCASFAGAAPAARDPAPWMAADLGASPADIARAARALPVPADATRQVLLDERVYRFAPDGTINLRWHHVFRVLNEAGVSGAGLEVPWQPWTQTRPEVRVRVIGSDGTSQSLDPSTIEDAGASQGALLYGDGRVLRAPYPALSVGAVVEQEVTMHDSTAASPGASMHSELLAGILPTVRARVVLDAPSALPLRWAVHGPLAVKPQRKEIGGRVVVTFEVGPRPALQIPPEDAPLGELIPLVSFSVGGSWRDVAQAYARLAESELAKANRAELERTARAALGATPTGDAPKAVAALLAFVRHEVRYAGIEFGKSSIVPHDPLQTLQRRYGDCKDQALLLAGLLRAIGIGAEVALLRSGVGPDVDDALPGMNGFNHAIVYIPGARPQWIDPTSEFTPVGDLPVPDQGRLALVASGQTHGLVRTPVAPLGTNRLLQTREVFLAEQGPARVIERLEAFGSFDRQWRTLLARIDAGRVRDLISTTAVEGLGGHKATRSELTDIHRLDVPFRTEVEVADSTLAFTDATGAQLAVSLQSIVDDLPSWARPSQKSPRTVDVAVAEPAVFEWTTRVTPPPGLVAAAPPKDDVVALGPLQLREHFAVDKGGVVVAALRIEIAKSRFSAAEVEAIRAGCREAAGREPLLLKFTNVGHAHLQAGRVREAIVEYRRLVALHPKEALHHTELADALLRVGLGEAARAEAARAVALEPLSVDALLTQVWVLTHDLIGRDYEEGYDRAGSERAIRRALELDPKNGFAHGDLAVWLEHDAAGRRYASAATAMQAVREYRAIDKVRSAQLGFDGSDLYVLLNFARWQELEEATRGPVTTAERAKLRIAAVAMRSGVAAALAEADAMPSELREQGVRDAADALLSCRHYTQAAALFERAAQQPGAPAWVGGRADVARRIRRFEDAPLDPRDPASAVLGFYVAFLREYDDANLLARVRAICTADAGELGQREADWLIKVRRSWRNQQVPLDVIRDAVVTMGTADKEGDDKVGYRVRFTKPFGAGVDTKYVVREHGQYRLLTPLDDVRPLGKRALAALDAGDIAAARRWLGWAAEAYRGGDPVDPNVSSPYTQVWNASASASAPADVLRIAAWMLLWGRVEADNRVALAGLRGARAALPAGVPADAVDAAIARLQLTLDQPADALAVVDAAPRAGSRVWFGIRTAALARLRRWDDLRRAADAQLQLLPDDAGALRALAQADEAQDRWDGFDAHLRALARSGRATASDFNKLAWDALFHAGIGGRALDDARRANEMTQRRNAGELHTLAAIEAELGNSHEAYTTLLESIDQGTGKPRPEDFYVLGRIAESVGVPEAAIADYRRAVAEKIPGAPWRFATRELAQKRLLALTAAK